MKTSNKIIGAVAAGLLTVAFVAADPPGVENVVPQLDTDSAEAGRQWRYSCTIPRDFGDRMGGDFARGNWKNSRLSAKLSALAAAANGDGRRGWSVNYDQRNDEFDFSHNGQVIYSKGAAFVNCYPAGDRILRGSRGG